jgi:hypothetical protein
MSLRWLSGMVGGGRGRPGIRRKMAPEAQRDLVAEIDADVVAVRRVWARAIVLDPDDDAEPEQTVIARVDAEARLDVTAWLEGTGGEDAQPEARTDWVFFPSTPEAILIGVVEGGEAGTPLFRFNLRFPADRYRRHLEALAESGLLESPCTFVEVQAGPLRHFLRELPPVPVV